MAGTPPQSDTVKPLKFQVSRANVFISIPLEQLGSPLIELKLPTTTSSNLENRDSAQNRRLAAHLHMIDAGLADLIGASKTAR